MKLENLTEKQVKMIYCAALGWHSGISIKPPNEYFDEMCDGITYEFEYFENGIQAERITIREGVDQIEITHKMKFRCGASANCYPHETGYTGTMFDLPAVYRCLRDLGFDVHI